MGEGNGNRRVGPVGQMSTRVGIAGGRGFEPPNPSSCLHTLIFEQKSALNFDPCRAGLTIWWAIRTPQHRGPTGKLAAEEGERGGEGCPLEGCPLPNLLGSGERCISSSAGSGQSLCRKSFFGEI